MSTVPVKQSHIESQHTTEKGRASSYFPSRFAFRLESLQFRAAVLNDRVWLIGCLSLLLVGTLLRLYALELKPMHHDEGVNGYFLTALLRQGVYRYDPTNYHGPTLYYLSLPLVALFGLDVFGLRLLTAVAGSATILLVLDLRRYLGTIGTLAAAALLTFSPGAVFYSRYFIHETLFVLFTLGIVTTGLRFFESGKSAYLVLAVSSAALLFATKETAFVSIVTIALAWFVAWWWVRKDYTLDKLLYSIFRFPLSARKKSSNKGARSPNRLSVAKLGGRDRLIMLFVYAVGLFLLINLLFYSSFLTNWPGVKGAVDSLQVWTSTGTSAFHGKSFNTYIDWMLQEEIPILLLAIGGSWLALFGERVSRFAIFAGAWGFGMLLAYSLIPYKTPWLMLSFIVPLAIAGGWAIECLSQRSVGRFNAPIPAFFLLGICLFISFGQTFILNFRQYDNDRYPYVYAHTNRELKTLVQEVESVAQRAATKEIGVSIASPENWPLPWYFRDNSKVAYVGTILERYDAKETPIVIGRESSEPNEDQSVKLRAVLGQEYQQLGSYALRPGVKLALFVRRDLTSR